LIAPIKIGKNSTIGAGSVITDNIPPNSLALERSKLKILEKNRKK
jgi:bifunctional UDP-N-acetylglucosamine pyrophosphorylase/glucosamine-1-phosphate N-acetyltransferase